MMPGSRPGFLMCSSDIINVMRDTLSSHKKRAWEAFSKFIRTRDCLRTTLSTDSGACCTCNREYLFNQLQAGHFIDGRHGAVLFSEQGVHAQCYACNIRLHGNKVKYWLFMEKYYGREAIDSLIAESNNTVIYKKSDYDEIAQGYHIRTLELLTNPDLAVTHDYRD